MFLWAYRDCSMLDLKNDKRFRYVLIFKNHGEGAGASIEHPHSQLIALPIVPRRVREEVDNCWHYYDEKERCIFCDIIRHCVSATPASASLEKTTISSPSRRTLRVFRLRCGCYRKFCWLVRE